MSPACTDSKCVYRVLRECHTRHGVHGLPLATQNSFLQQDACSQAQRSTAAIPFRPPLLFSFNEAIYPMEPMEPMVRATSPPVGVRLGCSFSSAKQKGSRFKRWGSRGWGGSGNCPFCVCKAVESVHKRSRNGSTDRAVLERVQHFGTCSVIVSVLACQKTWQTVTRMGLLHIFGGASSSW